MTPRSAQRYTIDANGCWNWGGYLRRDGYGQVWHNNTMCGAHRAFYELHVGPIPAGLDLDHLCRNRACVNPQHLEPVTREVNGKRSPIHLAAVNARKTHCIHGHEFTPENTLRSEGPKDRPRRRCRTCLRETNLRTKQRARLAAANIKETAA